jgi:exonuclease VII small subunit
VDTVVGNGGGDGNGGSGNDGTEDLQEEGVIVAAAPGPKPSLAQIARRVMMNHGKPTVVSKSASSATVSAPMTTMTTTVTASASSSDDDAARKMVDKVLKDAVGEDAEADDDNDEQEQEGFEKKNVFDQMEKDAVKMQMSTVSEAIQKIRMMLEDLDTQAWNKHHDGDLTTTSFEEIITSLETVTSELEGTLRILEG